MPVDATRIQTSIPQAPVTQRMPYNPTPAQNERLTNPGTARATIAASLDAPHGTLIDDWAAQHRHRTVLQQHVDFFDIDGDGVISPLDTFRGMRAMGFGIFLSVFMVVSVHLGISYATVDGVLPDLLFRIYTKNIHKGKHASDTGTYDNEGRFIPQKFEDLFAEYSSAPGKDSLTKYDLWNSLSGHRVLADILGSIGAIAEWIFVWLLISPKDGALKKDDVRRVYDGSLFAEFKEKNASGSVDRTKRD